MSTIITISDSDLEALRMIRNLVNCDAHLTVLDGILATAAVAAAAERPVRGAIGMDAVHRGIEHRDAGEWVCPACGDACTLDFARLVWNCDGCLATFSAVVNHLPVRNGGRPGMVWGVRQAGAGRATCWPCEGSELRSATEAPLP